MLRLPHGRVLLIVGWLLVLTIILGSLIPAMPRVGIAQGDKILHFLGYFSLTLWFAGLYPPRRLWLIALGFIFMGGMLEILQGVLSAGREMDIYDFAVNTVAIASACLAALMGLSQWSTRLEAWLTRRPARQE